MFNLKLIDLPKIYSEDTSNGRFYTTPKGDKYQSVTTFLSKFSDHQWLDDWIERVGEETAKRVSVQASRRGTAVHNILEQMVLNNPQYSRGQMPNNLMMAESIRKVLLQRVRAVYGLEIGLWSDSMKIAGRADMLALWDDAKSIVDFKTSKYIKNEEDILNYFLQCTLYALMVEEITGVQIPQIVVIIGVDNEDPQVFVKKKEDYIDKINDMLEENKIISAQ
jgi:hypothetical protein